MSRLTYRGDATSMARERTVVGPTVAGVYLVADEATYDPDVDPDPCPVPAGDR